EAVSKDTSFDLARSFYYNPYVQVEKKVLKWLIEREKGPVYKILFENGGVNQLDTRAGQTVLEIAIKAHYGKLCSKFKHLVDFDIFSLAVCRKNKKTIQMFKELVPPSWISDSLRELYEAGEDLFQEFILHWLKKAKPEQLTPDSYFEICMRTAMSIGSDCANNLISMINNEIELYKNLKKTGSTIGIELENLYKNIQEESGFKAIIIESAIEKRRVDIFKRHVGDFGKHHTSLLKDLFSKCIHHHSLECLEMLCNNTKQKFKLSSKEIQKIYEGDQDDVLSLLVSRKNRMRLNTAVNRAVKHNAKRCLQFLLKVVREKGSP